MLARVWDLDGLAKRGIIGGVISYFSFGSIMMATRLGEVGQVAVLRETSTVFAVIIGVLFLNESMGLKRLVMILFITLGAVCVGVSGVITSPQGAVLSDILHRLRDRFPRKVVVWPVTVQGELCADQVSKAIRGFNAISRHDSHLRPDVIIIARGGGSIEDLWAFNEESLVREVALSEIPIISGIGHEPEVPGGPAAEAGIQSGDIILVFDKVEVKNTKELVNLVGNTDVGKKVDIAIRDLQFSEKRRSKNIEY